MSNGRVLFDEKFAKSDIINSEDKSEQTQVNNGRVLFTEDIAKRIDPFQSADEKLITHTTDEQKYGGIRQGETRGEEAIRLGKETISNIPSSAKELVKDTAQTVIHPIDTAKGVIGTAVGGVQKLIPGEQGQEEKWDAVTQYAKDRYGGKEQLINSVVKDPIGVLTDFATVLTPTGSLLKKAGKTAQKTQEIGKVGRALEKTGDVLQKTGSLLDPIAETSKAVKVIAKAVVPEKLPAALYKSAAKFSTPTGTGIERKNRLAKTALKEGVLPNETGINVLRDKIDGYKQYISSIIDEGTKRGELIDTNELFVHLPELKEAQKLYPKAQKRINIINEIENDIIEFNELNEMGKLTPNQVQKFKQNIYKDLERFYTSVNTSPVEVSTQKAIARGAKESLENRYPQLKKLNKSEGDLIELSKEIERRTGQMTNNDIFSLGMKISPAAGRAIAGNAGTFAGIGLGLLEKPQIKARTAIALHNLKNRGVPIRKGSNADKLIKSIGLSEAERLLAITPKRIEKEENK